MANPNVGSAPAVRIQLTLQQMRPPKSVRGMNGKPLATELEAFMTLDQLFESIQSRFQNFTYRDTCSSDGGDVDRRFLEGNDLAREKEFDTLIIEISGITTRNNAVRISKEKSGWDLEIRQISEEFWTSESGESTSEFLAVLGYPMGHYITESDTLVLNLEDVDLAERIRVEEP